MDTSEKEEEEESLSDTVDEERDEDKTPDRLLSAKVSLVKKSFKDAGKQHDDDDV